MNTHFRNSTFGFVIYASVIVIVILATIFIFWYMLRGYKSGLYEENTMLGNVYLGGLSEEEVVPKMVDRTNEWIGDETIVFTINYQGYEYEIDREIFVYDFDTSLFYLKEGEENPLIVTFQGNARSELLSDLQNAPYLEDVSGYIDFDLMFGHIIQDVASMKTFSQKNVEDYLVESYAEVVGSYEISLPATVQAQFLVESITDTEGIAGFFLDEKSEMSILQKYEELFDDRTLSYISKGILGAIHETNLAVYEIYYNPIIDLSQYLYVSYPYYGLNVYIDRYTERDFQIFNPNESGYQFVFSALPGNTLLVEIVGLPFVNDISTDINIIELPYPTLEVSNTDDIRNGVNGRFVEIIRTTVDVYGEMIVEEMMYYEFYPPIEEHIYAP